MTANKRVAGQAAVEAAITLPLTVFLILGSLQLFMLEQGRMLAEYAAFRAVRAGSVNYGNCDAMTHAAIASLMPSYAAAVDPRGGNPATFFVSQFNTFKNNLFPFPAINNGTYNGALVWLIREKPTAADIPGGVQDTEFDQFQTAAPMRLEVRMIFWFPMKIPFANWVMFKMFMATAFGFSQNVSANPISPTEVNPNWVAGGTGGLNSLVVAEMTTRNGANAYSLPLQATYSMRMMTPAKAINFATQNCPAQGLP